MEIIIPNMANQSYLDSILLCNSLQQLYLSNQSTVINKQEKREKKKEDTPIN